MCCYDTHTHWAARATTNGLLLLLLAGFKLTKSGKGSLSLGLGKQSKHVQSPFMACCFTCYHFSFSFCIYFMPGEKYNLFSALKVEHKCTGRGQHLAGPLFPLRPYVSFVLHIAHCAAALLCFNDPYTALHELVKLWKLSSAFFVEKYQMTKEYYILYNYFCGSCIK